MENRLGRDANQRARTVSFEVAHFATKAAASSRLGSKPRPGARACSKAASLLRSAAASRSPSRSAKSVKRRRSCSASGRDRVGALRRRVGQPSQAERCDDIRHDIAPRHGGGFEDARHQRGLAEDAGPARQQLGVVGRRYRQRPRDLLARADHVGVAADHEFVLAPEIDQDPERRDLGREALAQQRHGGIVQAGEMLRGNDHARHALGQGVHLGRELLQQAGQRVLRGGLGAGRRIAQRHRERMVVLRADRAGVQHALGTKRAARPLEVPLDRGRAGLDDPDMQNCRARGCATPRRGGPGPGCARVHPPRAPPGSAFSASVVSKSRSTASSAISTSTIRSACCRPGGGRRHRR